MEGLFYFSPDGHLHTREDYYNRPESKDVIERYLARRALRSIEQMARRSQENSAGVFN